MDNKLKNAFDAVRAESELKDKTKAYISHQIVKREGRERRTAFSYRRLAPILVCVLLAVVFTGCGLYFTPTAVISIDINPSIELSVNRFDRVLSAEGCNDDGETFASTLSVNNFSYQKAVEKIIASETVEACLERNEILSIAVIAPEGEQSGRMLRELQSCTAGQKNTYCTASNPEELSQAHLLGLSYGKYRAYLRLSELDESITPDEVSGMTMREIRDLIYSLSGEEFFGGCAGEGNGKGFGQGGGFKKTA